MAYDWTSLAVQWLRFHASTAWSTGQIPGRGTKIPHAAWHGLKINKKIKIKIKKKNALRVLLLFYMYVWGLSNFGPKMEISQISWHLIDVFVFLNHKDWL